jgi:hypothetical protein
MTETFNTRHTLSGKLQRLTADQISVFPDYLEIVADDAKPYEPGMFKPGKVGEFKNPEPAPASVEAAQIAYDEILAEGHAPNSKVAREAKAGLDRLIALAETQAAAAAEATQQIQNGEQVTAIEGQTATEGEN